MILNTPTMFAVIIAVSAILAAAIAFIAYRRQRDLQLGAVALALHGVAYTLFGLRGQISDFISIVVGNFILGSVFALFGEGIYLFQNRSPPRWLLWPPVAIVTVSFVFLLNDQQTRFVVSGLVFSLQCLFILVAVSQKRYETAGRGQYVLATGIIVVLCLMLFRVLAVSVGGVQLGSFTDTNPIQGYALLLTVFATLCFALGLLTMNQERLARTAAGATAKLTSSERHYRRLVETANEGIGVAEAGIVRFVNPEMLKLTGYEESEIVGRHFAEFIHEHDREIALANYQKRLQGQLDELKYVVRIVTKHKGVRWFEISGASFDWEGRPATLNFLNDITERQRTEAELRQSEERYRTLTEWAPSPLVVHNGEKVMYINPAAIRMFGANSAEDLVGREIFSLVHPDSREVSRQRVNLSIQPGDAVPLVELKFLKVDGTTMDVEAQARLIIYDGAEALQVAMNDVTERRQTEQAQRIAATAFESQQGMAITNSANVILRVNKAFSEITGYTAEESLGQTPRMLSSGRHDKAFYAAMWNSIKCTGQWQGEIWNRRKSGEVYPEWLSISTVKDEADMVTNYVAAFSDITSRKTAEDRIETLAFSDPLTGLPNRRLLMDRLEQAMASATRHGHQDALLFVDLDDFKTINDTLGHDKGDLLLKQIAQRLSSCVREGDTVARLGGDEFVVLLNGLSENAPEAAAQAQVVAQKILDALGQPYELDGRGHYSSASVGITLFGGNQREAIEEPLKRAELAMYQAKAAGRSALRFFEPEMYTAVLSRASLEFDLRQALAQGQFLLYYQPQCADGDRLIGVEALVRWQHPQRGLVSPLEFIPVAEASGLILPLGQWVLRTACAQLALWANRAEVAPLTIAVNVSARELRQPNFVDQVLSILQESGANPSRLKLELTESILVDNVEDTIVKMRALRESGVRFSLDDFGTGYSSLSYLKRLPLDQLKIDRSFVVNIFTDRDDAAIAKMVVALAQSLELEVIAEGVENEAQWDFLASVGCRNYQGYLFSKPLPIEEFEVFAAKVLPGLNS